MAESTARDTSRIEEIERVHEDGAGLDDEDVQDDEVGIYVIVEVCVFVGSVFF